MTRQKPPDCKGPATGFPYSILWEEFGPIWDELGAKPDAVGKSQALLAGLSESALEELNYPTQEKISELVGSFGDELGVSDTGSLAERLYLIAAAYSLPKLQRATGQDPVATRKRLKQIAKNADQLVSLLGELDSQLAIVLGVVRSTIVDKSAKPYFHREVLETELSDLAATARLCASEIPSMPRGRRINVLEARLMEAATGAIGEASRVEIEVKQADSAGRNPRPASPSAELLFRYLDLVEPKMSSTAKERLFAEFSRAWVSVTAKEIEEDRYPRKWRRRTGRTDLISDMSSKSQK